MSGLSFAGRTILVVGGAGFVGSNLVAQLLQQNPARVVIVDNLLSSDASNVPDDPRVAFMFGLDCRRRHPRATAARPAITCSIWRAITAISRPSPIRWRITTTTP